MNRIVTALVTIIKSLLLGLSGGALCVGGSLYVRFHMDQPALIALLVFCTLLFTMMIAVSEIADR